MNNGHVKDEGEIFGTLGIRTTNITIFARREFFREPSSSLSLLESNALKSRQKLTLVRVA